MTDSWKFVQLGKVCEIYQPKTISKKQLSEDGEYPVFGANGIIGRYHEYNHEHPQLLLTCRGATCGSINISLPKSWITGNAMVIRPLTDELDIRYLEYFCRGGIDFSTVITGAAQPQITRQSLSPVEVTYPPLAEQKRIVAILDEAFVGIDTAIANTEKNLANARELFESYLNSAFSKQGDGWCSTLLGEICDVRDGTHDSPKYVEDGIPFVTQKNIRKEGLSFDLTKYITASDHENFYKRSNVAQGDVLISMIGANRGMACIVDDSRTFSIKNVGLIKANEKLNMRFILYYLKTSLAKSYIEEESRGGAQPFIGLGKLRAFPVVTAPISIQDRLVSELDAVHVEIYNLEKNYQQKLTSLNELKQSLLQKAFSGELTMEGEKIMDEAVA